MKKILRIANILFLITSLFVVKAEALKVNQSAPDFNLKDSFGNDHNLSDFKGSFVVLEWVNYDCPFVRKHYETNNMQNLQKMLTDDKVIWLSINSSAPGKQGNFSPKEINQKVEALKAVPTAYLIDLSGDVGRLYDASTTPHVFLINPEGVLVYQGAIDDIPSFDKKDVPKANNLLIQAYQEIKQGKSISVSNTKSYGCSVKY